MSKGLQLETMEYPRFITRESLLRNFRDDPLIVFPAWNAASSAFASSLPTAEFATPVSGQLVPNGRHRSHPSAIISSPSQSVAAAPMFPNSSTLFYTPPPPPLQQQCTSPDFAKNFVSLIEGNFKKNHISNLKMLAQ